MKPVFYFLLLIAALGMNACAPGKAALLSPDTPRSDVPDALTGNWLSGTFAMSDWWSYDGSQYEGNPYKQSVAFAFKKMVMQNFTLRLLLLMALAAPKLFLL